MRLICLIATVLTYTHIVAAQTTTSETAETTDTAPGFHGNAAAIRILNYIEQSFDAPRSSLCMDVVCTRTIISAKGGQRVTGHTATIWLRGPDKLVWLSTGERPWSVLSDGKAITAFLPECNVYTINNYNPRALDSTLAHYSVEFGTVLTHLVCKTLRGSIPVTFTRGEDIGQEDFQGNSQYHVRFGTKEALLDVWLNERDLPARIQEIIESGSESDTLLMAIQWKSTRFNPPIPEPSFVIRPPENSHRVEHLPPRSDCATSGSKFTQ